MITKVTMHYILSVIPIMKAQPSRVLARVWALRGNCRARLKLNQYKLVLNWKVAISWQAKLFHSERTEINKPESLWFESPCQRDDSLMSVHYTSSLTERVAGSIFPENIQNFNSLLTWHHSFAASLSKSTRSQPTYKRCSGCKGESWHCWNLQLAWRASHYC